jgi:glycosyltransferase involved in cell wall biosynthesis
VTAAPVLHFVLEWLPPSETFVANLVTNLGRPAVVVSSKPPVNLDRFPAERLVDLARWTGWVPVRVRQQAVTALLTAVAARRGVRLVHVHHGYQAVQVMGVVRRRRLSFVISLHGHDVTGYAEDNPGVYDGILDRADAVIVPSRFLVDTVVALGARPERLHVIPSGVDTTWFTPSPLPDGPPEVTFVGRFVEKKGIDTLVEAWPQVRAAVPDARLRFLGYGPLEALARSAGPGTEVVLAPDRAAVRDAIRRATVVASPSHLAGDDAVETLLIVNLEAQASGRPVVTTRHGGIPEYVRDGETALVVPEADADALADALVRILTEPGLAARLGAAGPDFVQQFDVRAGAQRVEALYRELGA